MEPAFRPAIADPQLYDAPETKTLVAKWVTFYKKHRSVLDGDIIHLRRPDGQDLDAILHVDPMGQEKGLVMIYNPLKTTITRQLEIPVYYTGLKNKVIVHEQEEAKSSTITIVNDGRGPKISYTVTIPGKGYTYLILK